MQVYNDTIYDLLDENAFGLGGRASLRLKEDAAGRVIVAGLREVSAMSASHLADTSCVAGMLGAQ